MSNKNKYGAKRARKQKSFWFAFGVITVIAAIVLGITWTSTGNKLVGFWHVVNRITCWGFILAIPTAAYAFFRFHIAGELYKLERQYADAKNSLSADNTLTGLKKALDMERAKERLAGGHFGVLKETKDGDTRWMLITMMCIFTFAVMFVIRIILLAPAMRYELAKILRIIALVILLVSVAIGIYAFVRTLIKTRIGKMKLMIESAYTKADLEDDLDNAVEEIEEKRRQENSLQKPSKRVPEEDLAVTAKERKKLKKEFLKKHRTELLDGEPWTKDDVKEFKRGVKRFQKWDKNLSLGFRFLK